MIYEITYRFCKRFLSKGDRTIDQMVQAATAMDYSADALTTQTFFATVQNKLHFAIHGRTAAELIVERADSKKEKMGDQSYITPY